MVGGQCGVCVCLPCIRSNAHTGATTANDRYNTYSYSSFIQYCTFNKFKFYSCGLPIFPSVTAALFLFNLLLLCCLHYPFLPQYRIRFCPALPCVPDEFSIGIFILTNTSTTLHFIYTYLPIEKLL